MNIYKKKAKLIKYYLMRFFSKDKQKWERKINKLNYPSFVNGERNKVFLYDGLNNKSLDEIGGLENFKLFISGNDNEVKISLKEILNKKLNINIRIEGDNNKVFFDKNVKGNWAITELGTNCLMTVGENTDCGDFAIALHGNEFHVGRDCMISVFEEVWTDGHSVIDCNTKELLNYPKSPVLIGNHVWLGRRVTLTKGAQIPDDCIVGIGAIVTKPFTEPHCVIAGVPAKVVKHGISWDGRRPQMYKKEFNK